MSMELNGFDANTIEPNVAYDPLPSGWYKAVIVESEEKPTKAQTGSYLQLTLEIIEGDHQGRRTFDRLNLNNPNQTAVDIANRTLSAICRAVGVMTPRSSSDLHDKPLMVKVAVKPATAEHAASNEVKGYEACGSATTTTAKPAAKPGVPAWKQKR